MCVAAVLKHALRRRCESNAQNLHAPIQVHDLTDTKLSYLIRKTEEANCMKIHEFGLGDHCKFIRQGMDAANTHSLEIREELIVSTRS